MGSLSAAWGEQAVTNAICRLQGTPKVKKKLGYGESNPELPRSGMRGGNVSRYTISDLEAYQ